MKHWFTRLVAASVCLVAIGCGGGGGEISTDFFVRFTNNIVDLPGGVDVVLNQEPYAVNLGYGGSTPDYDNLTTEEELYIFDLFRAGTQNIIDSWVEIPRLRESHHLVSIGAADAGPQQPLARIVPVLINRNRPGGANARLIVLNGFVRQPGRQSPNVDLLRSGKIAPEISDLEFAGFKSFLLAAGTYDFEVRIAGLMSGTLFTKTGVTVEGGKVYLVVIRGVEGGSGVFAPDIQFIEEPLL